MHHSKKENKKMKKRAREEEKKAVATAHECLDREALDLLNLLDLPSRQERSIVALCNRWRKERSSTANVRYDKSEDEQSLVARDPSACALKAWMMRCLLWRSYYRIVLKVSSKPLRSMFHLTQILQERGWDVGGFRGNSLLVERKEKFEVEVKVRDCDFLGTFPKEDMDLAAQYVYEQTQMPCTLVEKSLFMSREDFYKLNGPKNYGKVPVKQRMCYVLETVANSMGLRRTGLSVMFPHERIPQVYLPRMQAEEWIRKVMMQHPGLSPYDMNEALQWFERIDSMLFPIVHSSTRYIGFRDCCFDLSDLVPKNYDDVQGEFCTVYFDALYEDASTAPTPLFDQLIQYQLTGGECDMLRLMIGRLQYPLNVHDHWQVYLNIWGNGGCGKSSVGEVIKSQFSEHSVGTIGGTQEKTFGLQSLHDKRVILVPDLPENFHTCVNQQDFQRMVSGEDLSGAVKSKSPWSGTWKVPIVLIGNRLPKYRDQNNSISRRTFALRFLHKIPQAQKNTGMTQQIIRSERASILLRCVRLYRERAKMYENRDFWEMAGPEFKHMQNETLEHTSPVDVFLSEADDCVKVVKAPGLYFPWSIFASEYYQFLERHFKHESKDIDKVKLEARGFRVREMNMCSNCGKRAIRAECKCGELRHRKKLLMIQNMAMQYYDGVHWENKKADIGKFMGKDYSTKELDAMFDQTEKETKQEQEEEIAQHLKARESLKKS
jgi:hypothetical protein